MFSLISGYRYDDEISERANKEAILNHYGLLGDSATTIKKCFDSSNIYLVEEFLREQSYMNRYCSVLIHTGKNESIGGCGVIYVMSEQDIIPCIESLVDSNSVTIYSRQKSTELQLIHLDNYPQRKVRFGGGFRIQVDGVRMEQKSSSLLFFVSMSFDDFGSRVLSEAVIDNDGAPVRHMVYEVSIVNGQLAVSPSLRNDFDHIHSADEAVTFILDRLFERNASELNKFLKAILALRSVSNIHQLEGMYGVNELGVPTIEIIDFDGMDTFDLERYDYIINKTPQERLFGCQLEQIGFIKRIDLSALSSYLSQEADIEACLSVMCNDADMPNQIISVITKVEGELLYSYFNRLKPYIFAFNVLRCLIPCGNTCSNTTEKYKYVIQDGDIDVYLLEISGVGVAFLLERCEVIHFWSEYHARDTIMRVFGPRILPVYLSNAREGD